MTGRYPAISFTLDGEAVVCRPGGIAIFDALHRRGTVSEAMLYPFDLLELDGEDLCALPLGDRKKRLPRLLGKIVIFLSRHTDEDGATIFQQACKIGRSRDWLKVKNPDSPAMIRAQEAEW